MSAQNSTFSIAERVHGRAAVAVLDSAVTFRRDQVLNQRSALMNVQDLEPAADPQDRHIAIQSFGDCRHLRRHRVQGRECPSRASCFAVSRRIDVVTAHQQQTLAAVEGQVRAGAFQDAFDAGRRERSLDTRASVPRHGIPAKLVCSRLTRYNWIPGGNPVRSLPCQQGTSPSISIASAHVFIRLGYDIHFDIPVPVPIVALLNVHPSRAHDLAEPDVLRLEPPVEVQQYQDCFGNICSRFLAPAGVVELQGSTTIIDSGELDPYQPDAASRRFRNCRPRRFSSSSPRVICEVDRLQNMATDLFAGTEPGWARVQAICNWVNLKVEFGYHHARSTKTALDVYTERTGVCRDFQHLAIAFCRCMNIPARYATGYLGDFGVPPSASPMDFSAWFEAYLDGRWWTFDARHNQRRIGRVLMATGRDAADVAITTSFGAAVLRKFTVVTEELSLAPELVEAAPQNPAS